jgi:hypothetical protein
VAFCGAAVLERQAAAQLRQGPVIDGRLSPWVAVHEKAARTLATLAVRLRLGPSSRIDPKTVGRRARGARAGVDAFAELGLTRGEDDG